MTWLANFMGLSGTGPVYAFWSGFGSDLGEVVILGAIVGAYRKHTCHVKGCWRLSRRPVEGTSHIVCHRHHPQGAPSAQRVLDDHAAANR